VRFPGRAACRRMWLAICGIQREGRVRLSTLSAATIARLANEHLRAHPELISEAAQSDIVQNLLAHRRRGVDRQRELVWKCHERIGALR
jgi:hypothetical protein